MVRDFAEAGVFYMMHIHKEKHACHSDNIPMRGVVEWAYDKGQVCYMTWEQASTIDHGCFGCNHPLDKRITKHKGI